MISEEQMKTHILTLSLTVLLLILTSFVVQSCALFEQKTNTKTYIWSTEVVQQVKELGKIESCPQGQSAMALAVQTQPNGGAIVTVRCQ